MGVVPLKSAIAVEIPTIEIVDVGAMIEGEDRYAGLVAQAQRVTGFEPDAEQYEKLRAARRGPYQYLPYFLGGGGAATFHITRWPGCSSLYQPDPAVIDLFTSIGATPGGNFEVVKTIAVETQRLDDVAECPAADYLKLDVQGAELDVLRGAEKSLATCGVIELEAEFVPLYLNQPLFGDIQCFLRERGFVLHKLIDVAGRCFRPWAMTNNPYVPMSQLLWADAIFVRDFSKPDAMTDEQLIKSAAILHDAYRSYDLAFFLLSQYDRRHGTNLGPTYAQKLVASGQIDTLFMNVKLAP